MAFSAMPMTSTVPNANTRGRGGEVAALARLYSDSALVRMAAVVAGERVVEPEDIVYAARTVLRGGEYISRDSKLRALEALDRLVEVPRTPDGVAVRAS